uniref:Uncharacterized protein n=1 Tax=Arundo donax TaxID=35708 RepID=A0A0A9CZ68_ARUDO
MNSCSCKCLNKTFKLLTIDWASRTEGWRLSYSDRRGSKEDMKVDLSCCAACNAYVRWMFSSIISCLYDKAFDAASTKSCCC